MSLREAERRSGRGRGNLSQVETGKARPNRSLVEWYDVTFHGDGLLLTLFFEARTGPQLTERAQSAPPEPTVGDQFEVAETMMPQGAIVGPDATVGVGWTLANIGTVDWQGRALRRIGAHAGPRLLASPPVIDIPDCDSGSKVDLQLQLRAPAGQGTCVAYWQMVTASGAPCFVDDPYLSVQLVVR